MVKYVLFTHLSPENDRVDSVRSPDVIPAAFASTAADDDDDDDEEDADAAVVPLEAE